jgi:ribosomal protein S18 acetylase RimI-like enzyme
MERLAEINIVPAGPGDAAALAEVHVRSWRETYAGMLPAQYLARMSTAVHAARSRRQLSRGRTGDVVLAAEGPSGLVAYCAGAVLTGPPAGEAEVFTLYVLQSAQGMGLGRRLLATTARVLEAEGARSLRLWVLGGNSRAQDFYAHLGGVAVGERPVSGWGGGLREIAYRWRAIDALSAG